MPSFVHFTKDGVKFAIREYLIVGFETVGNQTLLCIEANDYPSRLVVDESFAEVYNKMNDFEDYSEEAMKDD